MKLLKILALCLATATLTLATTGREARADATAELATWLDLPMIGDYAIMYGDQWQVGTGTERTAQNVSQRWRILSMVARFFDDPENLSDDLSLYQVAALTLEPGELEEIALQFDTDYGLFSRQNSSLAFQSLSEFQRRNLGEVLRTRYLDRMRARVPAGPVRIVELQQYQLGEYDFEAQAFPFLQSTGSSLARLDVQPFSFLSVNTYASAIPVVVDSLPPVIPSALPIPVDRAEAFINTLGTEFPNRRAVFVAHLGELVGYERRDGELVARVDSVAAALYTDQDLSTGILAFELRERVDPAAEAAAAEAAARVAAEAAAAAAQAAALEAERLDAERLAEARAQVDGLDLAILGVALGMTEAEARAALLETQPAFEGGLFVTDTRMQRLTTGNGCTMPDLRILRRAFEDRSEGLPPDEVAALESEMIATLPVGCRPESSPLGASFPAIAELQGGRITDAVRVYLGSTNRVVAVVRRVSTGGRDLGIREGALTRYGAPVVNTAGDRVAYWPASPDTIARAAVDADFARACFPDRNLIDVSAMAIENGARSVETVQLNPNRFLTDCGALLGADFANAGGTFFLVDTTRLNRVQAEVERSTEAEEDNLEAEIKF